MQNTNMKFSEKIKEWEDALISFFLVSSGNILLFFVLKILNIDFKELFSIEYLTSLLSAEKIILAVAAAVLFSLTFAVLSFFKQRSARKQCLVSVIGVIAVSGLAGILLFNNYIISYIIFLAYSAAFIWISMSDRAIITDDKDKREVMKSNLKKFGISLTIGFVIAGTFAGFAYSEAYKKSMTESIIGKANEMIIDEAFEEMTFSDVVPHSDYNSFVTGKMSKSQMKKLIDKRMSNTSVYSKMSASGKNDFTESLTINMKTYHTQYGDEAYPMLSDQFEEWKNGVRKDLEEQIKKASEGLFRTMPMLESPFTLSAIVALSLISTFNTANFFIIRTLCVYVLFFVLQRDKTILNPEKLKDILYSQRRGP